MPLKHFNLETSNPTHLLACNEEKIIIKQIEVIEGDIQDLDNTIRITTLLPSEVKTTRPVNPWMYHSLRSNSCITDKDMNLPIKDCKYTDLAIEPKSNKRIVFKVYYTSAEGDPLRVLVDRNSTSNVFRLPESSRSMIIAKSSNARPIMSVSVDLDKQYAFQSLYGRIEKHILPALTDLSWEQLDEFGEVQMIDSATMNLIKRI